jgi:hypothetical protein
VEQMLVSVVGPTRPPTRHPSTITTPSPPTPGRQLFFATNAKGYVTPTAYVNGAIKCQQVSGGDGYSTMANTSTIPAIAVDKELGPFRGHLMRRSARSCLVYATTLSTA